MPKRSTPFQAIVKIVRQHYAQPGVTVTESKHLQDSSTGFAPEVDIVVEGVFDGEPLTVSIEVTERSRRQSIEWVHQMFAKHQHLPTNKLILISKNGFTKQALAAVRNEAGRAEALTPEVVIEDGEEVVTTLLHQILQVTPGGVALVVLSSDGQKRRIEKGFAYELFDVSGEIIADMDAVWNDLLWNTAANRQLVELGFVGPPMKEVRRLVIHAEVGELDYYSRLEGSAIRHRIEQIEMHVLTVVLEVEVPLVSTKLGNRQFGAAEVLVRTTPTVFVSTQDANDSSWLLSHRPLEKGGTTVSSKVDGIGRTLIDLPSPPAVLTNVRNLEMSEIDVQCVQVISLPVPESSTAAQ